MSKQFFDPAPTRYSAPETMQPEGDSWEEFTGDGRTSRHQVLGLQLINDGGKLWWIPYGAILWAEGTFNGTEYRFEVVRGDALYEVTFEGTASGLHAIVDRIMEGKRISVRCNGSTVTKITVKPVAKPGKSGN